MYTKPLGLLEREVMRVLWDSGDVSVKDVVDQISQKRPVAYTTIATILVRLHQKRLVTRKMRGTLYVYTPAVEMNSYVQGVASAFLKSVIKPFGDIGVVSFAKSIEKLPEARRKKLLDALSQYDKSK